MAVVRGRCAAMIVELYCVVKKERRGERRVGCVMTSGRLKELV